MNRLLLLVLVTTISCQSVKNTEKEIIQKQYIGTDQTITAQTQYASIGLIKLSDYDFFSGPLSELNPNKNIFPYELNTPLFSDYALKKRFIYLPQGKKINYEAQEVFGFPVGTIIIKNFYYAGSQINQEEQKILETRLLIHEEKGWKALPYIWNKAQTEAFLEITGGKIPITLTGKGIINYNVPDMNQCKSCHDKNGQMVPIGPTVRQLNRSYDSNTSSPNQLAQMQELGWLELPNTNLPKLANWSDQGELLNDRARAYLDINCAHCHNDSGPAKNSGLNLSIFETDNYRIGVNKKPIAAGRGSADLKYGIVPGKPDASILLHRMITTEPGTMMPELGRTIQHDEGIALIKEWIEKMSI
jgi:uncharacterized repeat protein (TIGR03806 family)